MRQPKCFRRSLRVEVFPDGSLYMSHGVQGLEPQFEAAFKVALGKEKIDENY